ncbi:MAG: amidohydrolase family protein [Planctomycetes bacterium]|nr:amidohydrolase family protein [Planctomycetota bacterium]
MRTALAAALLVSALPGLAFAQAEDVVVIRAGKVLTMNAQDEVIDHAVVLVRGGKIVAVGPADRVAVPPGAREVDARDAWLLPGFIDCHNHTAGSLSDLNDGVYLTNPGLRTLDTVAPENENLKVALAGGVTSVLLIPGSGNNMAGFGTVTRTAGRTQADMVLRAPGSIKVAQAGNPERYWFGVGRAYMNWNLGQTLEKARAYHAGWSAWEEAKALADEGKGPPPPPPPPLDLAWEDFRALFARRFPASVHTQMFQVVNKTITMLGDRFGLRVVLDHSTFDGFKNARLVQERPEIVTICGPRQYYFDRAEGRIVGVAARWMENGLREVGINTDAPVVPQEELTLQAALGCRLGLDPYQALRGLTIVPARALMIDGALGSIEVGKDADLAVWTGDPLDPRRHCRLTIVKGQVVYDAGQGRRF